MENNNKGIKRRTIKAVRIMFKVSNGNEKGIIELTDDNIQGALQMSSPTNSLDIITNDEMQRIVDFFNNLLLTNFADK